MAFGMHDGVPMGIPDESQGCMR